MSSSPVPDPNRLRPANAAVNGLQANAALTNNVPVSGFVPIAGSRLVTIRAKFSVNGTLQPYYRYPDNSARYDTSNPSHIAITANTEICITITTNGEPNLELEFTPAGDGSVSFVHVSQL